MPIKVQWDNDDKNMLRFDYYGDWKWEDLYTSLAEGNKLLDTVKHKVVLLINLRESSLLPKDALSQGRRVNERQHPNIDIHVVVGANAFIRRFAQIYYTIYGKMGGKITTHYVENMPEARALAAKRLNELASQA